MNRTVSTSGRQASREIRDLVQGALMTELLVPSARAWLISAWITDTPVIDNRGGEFSSLVPAFPEREIVLSEVLAELLASGTQLHVVTNEHHTNAVFIRRLRDRAAAVDSESRLDLRPLDALTVGEERTLHRKRFVTEGFVIWGSMNFTNSGIERNAEDVVFELDRAAVGRAINEMEQLYGEHAA